ncbi:uncharacterized protein LOC144128542 [Amblyomma americanum]
MSMHTEETVRFSLLENVGQEDVEPVMDEIKILRIRALRTGVSERCLLRLSQIVSASITPPTVASSILQCMVPAEEVPENVVSALSGALCSRQLTLGVKRGILRWLGAAFHALDTNCNRVVLTRVLLGFLDTPLCADAVSLLVLLASRKTATSFTMSCISKASQRKPSDELAYLASVFERCRSGSAACNVAEEERLEVLGLAWQAHMNLLQQDLFGNIVYEHRPENLGLWGVDSSTGGEQVAEAIQAGALNLKAFLLNPEIQRVLANNSSGHHLQAYFDCRLFAVLTDIFWNSETASGSEFFRMLVSAVNTWQEIPPVVEQWLMKVVGFWDGDHYWEPILALISSLSLSSPSHFFMFIIEPLLRLLFFLELEKQIDIFRCLCNLCRFWGLVEVPRSRGEREPSLFGREPAPEPMSAVQQLSVQVGRISVALLQLHPNHVVEVMDAIFDFHHMRLNVFSKTSVTMLSALPWPVVAYSVHSRNPLLLDGISKVCISQQTLLGNLRQTFPQPWLKTRISMCNHQVAWLGQLLTGAWKEACDYGPHLPFAELRAVGLFSRESDLFKTESSDWPLALWWQPELHEQVSELCRKHRVQRHELILDEKMWHTFLTILASSQPYTAKLMAEITKVPEV